MKFVKQKNWMATIGMICIFAVGCSSTGDEVPADKPVEEPGAPVESPNLAEAHEAYSEAWEQIVQDGGESFANGATNFEYGPWLENTEAHEAVTTYLDAVAGADLEALSEAEKIALSINAYNAAVVAAVLEKKKVDGDVVAPTDDQLIDIGGTLFGLDELRQYLTVTTSSADPRIYFSLLCVARGCKRGPHTLASAENLDKWLENGERDFINHSVDFGVQGSLNDFEPERVVVSDFLNAEADVFEVAYGSMEGFLIAQLQREIDSIKATFGDQFDAEMIHFDFHEKLIALLEDGEIAIEYQAFDWSQVEDEEIPMFRGTPEAEDEEE